jgi:hypothetical protein
MRQNSFLAYWELTHCSFGETSNLAAYAGSHGCEAVEKQQVSSEALRTPFGEVSPKNH